MFQKYKITNNAQIVVIILSQYAAFHDTPRQSPAKLLIGRNMRTQFDTLFPDTKDVVSNTQTDQKLNTIVNDNLI